MPGVPDTVGQAQERLLCSTLRSIKRDELANGRRLKKTNVNSKTSWAVGGKKARDTT